MTAVINEGAHRRATEPRWEQYGDLGLAALGVLAAVLVAVDVHGPVRGLVALSAALLVPGAALISRLALTDIWARVGLIIVASAALEAGIALVMAWTSAWHPQIAAAVVFAGSAALLLWQRRGEVVAAPRTGLTPNTVVGGPPLEQPETGARGAQGRSLGRTNLIAWVLLTAAVILWVVALGQTDVSDLGDWGLVSAFPIVWYLAVALTVTVSVIGLTARTVSTSLMTAAVGTLGMMLYASAVIVESVPRFPWVYKHIAVTRYIELHGSVDQSIDIYNRWPGFFSFTGYLGDVTGYTNPINYAGWAETIFTAVDIIIVIAIARAISMHARWYWTAAAVFTASNWVGQNYFSPQAFSFALYLSIFLVAFIYLQRQPRRFALRLERAVSRGNRAAAELTVEEDLPDHPVARRVWVPAAAAVLVIQAVVVASHQLTPYLAVLALIAPLALGYFRPLWMGLALAVLCVIYLAPNYDYVQHNFGLFSGFNPIDNATATPGLHLNSVSADIWQNRISFLLSAVVAVLSLLGLIRRVRAGHARTVLIVTWLAISPALSLLAQTYGGEGTLRVFFFALPWCAMAVAWLIWPSTTATVNYKSVAACSLVLGTLTGLFIVSYYQPEADVHVSRSDLAAAEWLDQHIERGDVVVNTAEAFPVRVGPHYNLLQEVVSLAQRRKSSDVDVTPTTVKLAAAAGITGVHRSFVLFSSSNSSARYADVHGLYKANELATLESTIESDATFVRIFQNSTVRIYQINK